jgi:hypothetical protein
MEFAEIGEIMGLAKAVTVRSLHRRAKEEFRRAVERLAGSAGSA